MSIEYILYFISVLGDLKEIAGVLLLISFLFCLFGGFIYSMTIGEEKEEVIKIRSFAAKCTKIIFIMMVLSGVISILIPSKQTMYAMVLTRYSKQSDIPAMVIKTIEKTLDEIIKHNN